MEFVMSFNKNAKAFIVAAEERFGIGATLSRDNITRVVNESGSPYPYWLVSKGEYRVGHGQYQLPDIGSKPIAVVEPEPELEVALMNSSQTILRQPKLMDESDPSIPDIYPDYVPFGFYDDLNRIVSSNMFYPVFVTGLSGNGKTLMVEQTCAKLKRECIRVNISI